MSRTPIVTHKELEEAGITPEEWQEITEVYPKFLGVLVREARKKSFNERQGYVKKISQMVEEDPSLGRGLVLMGLISAFPNETLDRISAAFPQSEPS